MLSSDGGRRENARNLLRDGDWFFCLGLAISAALLFSRASWNEAIEPAGDGLGYASRACALYGYLHSGQWSAFANLLVRPCQSILSPSYPLFFLMPKALAGANSYAVTMWITTFGLLAWAVCEMGRALDRREWAIPIFLLCLTNTISLTDFYAFYLDEIFLAICLVAAARQIKAWKAGTFASHAGAGFFIGLLFWVKPANALIVTGAFLVAEIVHAILSKRRSYTVRENGNQGTRHLWLLAGFLPMIVGAFACGAGQTIIQLFYDNEVNPMTTPLSCTWLLRLFYFPLCLSYYYPVLVIAPILFVSVALGRWLSGGKTDPSRQPFPLHFFLPIAICYFVLGEFFSFGMTVKPMRFLVIILPIVWVGIFRFLETRRVPSWSLVLFAVLYATIALSQKMFGIFPGTSELAEDNYQLTQTSWVELPRHWSYGRGLKNALCDIIARSVTPGTICVDSIEMRDALYWRLTRDDLLAGRIPSSTVKILFNQSSQCYEDSLTGANYLVLITFRGTQTSRKSWIYSQGFLGYANEVWFGEERLMDEMPLPVINGRSCGCLLRFHHPLPQTEARAAIEALHVTTTPPDDDGNRVNIIEGRRFSIAATEELLRKWFDRRLSR